MARRRAGSRLGQRIKIVAAALDDLRVAFQRRVEQFVGLFLRPGQAAGFTEHAQPQRIRTTDRHLRCPQHAAGAAFIANKNMRVVIQCPPFDKSGQIRHHAVHFQTGDKAGKMKRMGADVANSAAAPVLFRINAPGGLLIVL